MSSFKRIFLSVKSHIDSVADEFENHEALAGAAIKDLTAIGAKTRVQKHRIDQMVANHEQKIAELQKQADLWTQRALQNRDTDEQRALECTRRLRMTRETIERHEKQLNDSRALQTRVAADVTKIQQKLVHLKEQKEMLTARENRVRVGATLEKHQTSWRSDVEDVFERWENTLVGNEFINNDIPDEDALSREFIEQEDEFELKEILGSLEGEDQKNPPNS